MKLGNTCNTIAIGDFVLGLDVLFCFETGPPTSGVYVIIVSSFLVSRAAKLPR